MPIEEFDHYTVRAADFDASWRFYGEVLGLRCVTRTGTPHRAAFIYFEPGDKWLVHLAEAPREEVAALPKFEGDRKTGAFLHIATNAHGLKEMKARLEQHGWPYRERNLDARSLRQLHLLDPDGIEIEINFPLSEYTGEA